MPTISSPGLGSGLDIGSIVDQLIAIERRPIDRLQADAKAIQAKLSSFGLLQSYLGNLRDAANKLADATSWARTSAVSTDAGAVAATGGTSAVAGSYAIEVSQLAQAQSLSSRAYVDKLAAVGSGSLTIEIGTWAADLSSFTPSAAAAINIAIGPTETSVEAIRAKINAADAGVTASIVHDQSGARLVIRSSATGQASAVRISVVDDDGNATDNAGLSALAFDPPTGGGRMTQDLAAKDAIASVNGLAITSASNTLATVIEGVTLTLGRVTTAPVDVTVSMATDAMKKSVADFVKAYNEVNKYIADQTRYDGTTRLAGTLQGDRSTLALQGQLRGAVQTASAASSVFSRLSVLGIETQKDGSLKINDSKLDAALATQLSEVARAFSADDGLTKGFATAIGDLAEGLVASDGSVTMRSEAFRDSIRRNEREQDRLEDRIEATRVRLLRQYTALDGQLAKLNNVSNYITQQMAIFTNSMKSNK